MGFHPTCERSQKSFAKLKKKILRQLKILVVFTTKDRPLPTPPSGKAFVV